MILTDIHTYDIAMTHDMTVTDMYIYIKYTKSYEMGT